MDLTCVEKLDEVPTAERDRTIFEDDRVLDNLLANEFKYMPKVNYFNMVQSHVYPHMRKLVATWMLELCEEQMIEDQVFPLAVNLMDRFLCTCKIKVEQLQLLGAVCLLISSKLRTSNVLTIGLLCAYTDYSVTSELIEKWEVLVLSKLNWDVNGVTPFDFLHQVFQRCPWGMNNERLTRHAHILVSICITEPRLMETLPSVVAAACICSAARGLKLSPMDEIMGDLCRILKTRPPRVQLLAAIIDSKLKKLSRDNEDSMCHSPEDLLLEKASQIKDVLF